MAAALVASCTRAERHGADGPTETTGRSPGPPTQISTASPSSAGAVPSASPTANAAAASATAARRAAAPLDTDPYPWHQDRSVEALPAVDTVEQRFAPPEGFVRVPLEPDSFGAWLRRLPLAAPSTPVRSNRGRILRRADDPHVAAVTTLDVGTADLQQCADAVIRLHAEWCWSRGRRDMSYRAAAGIALPYARWARGERVVLDGRALRWTPSGTPGDDHASFRKYLDAVFSWANTVSLARQADAVALAELRAGDFMILPGGPGHTVLVLDLARDGAGGRAVLLGQSYMPAQSFQVLRPGRASAWFLVEPELGGIQTPFWPAPFPWSSLRRLQ